MLKKYSVKARDVKFMATIQGQKVSEIEIQFHEISAQRSRNIIIGIHLYVDTVICTCLVKS